MNKCSECVRFKEREEKRGTFHCWRQNYKIDKYPDDDACDKYWDRAEQERKDREHDAERERERKKKWAMYANKPPVKLLIEFDGYGDIPVCPVCGDLPYSMEQCYWCGQRFIQDEEIEEYNKPDVVEMKCFVCGGKMVGTISKYNGHFHGQCEECGATIIQ
ncbi:hypothetical protein AALA24_13545 [Anaerovoracaceae bacterium 42-11]